MMAHPRMERLMHKLNQAQSGSGYLGVAVREVSSHPNTQYQPKTVMRLAMAAPIVAGF